MKQLQEPEHRCSSAVGNFLPKRLGVAGMVMPFRWRIGQSVSDHQSVSGHQSVRGLKLHRAGQHHNTATAQQPLLVQQLHLE